MGYSSRLLGNPKYNSNPADYGVGDFNGDGVDDVIFAGPSWSNGTWDGISWSPVLLKSNGVGQYEIEIANQLTSTIHTRVIESGDFNNDGQDDFFFFDHGHDISPFSGAPNAAFFSSGSTLQNAAIPTFNDYSHGGDIGDVDGDGDLDILSLSMSGYSSTILLNDGAGQFSATTIGVSGSIKDPSWHSNPWEIPYTLTSETETFFNTAKLDDFTGDGLVDLLVGGQHYGHSFVAENLGNGIFDLKNAKELPTSAFFTGVLGTNEQLMEAVAIDLNGDGLNDIIGSYTTPSYLGRALQIFVNNGDATFRDESTARFPNGDNVAPNGQ